MSKLIPKGKKNDVTTVVPAPIAIDETEQFLKYKKLLDDGVITQEEFNAKKQILGL